MPFVKIKKGRNRGKYRSSSGKIYTARQMKAYYVTKGFKRKPRKSRRKKR